MFFCVLRRDKKICNILKPFLKKKKLFFTGIDVIGNYLTEISKIFFLLNFTDFEQIFSMGDDGDTLIML